VEVHVKRSLSRLAAGLVVAPLLLASDGAARAQGTVTTTVVVPSQSSGPLGLGIRDRVRNLFGMQPTAPTYQTYQVQQVPGTMPMQQVPGTMPMQQVPGTMPMQQVPGNMYMRPATTAEPPVVQQSSHTAYSPVYNAAAAAPVANVPPTNLKVAEKYLEKIGHEQDYSWITGHLFYVHTDGGKWVLRYTAVDEIDRYGGSVVLTPTVEMKNYREGDLVNVFGEVLNNGQSARPLGGALYRVNSIQLIERADPF
jgi:hypothetical protein